LFSEVKKEPIFIKGSFFIFFIFFAFRFIGTQMLNEIIRVILFVADGGIQGRANLGWQYR